VRHPQLNPIWLPESSIHPNADLRKLVKEQAERYGSPLTRRGERRGSLRPKRSYATAIEAALARAYEAPGRSTAEAKQLAAAEAPVLAQHAAASKKHSKLERIVVAAIFFLLLLAIAIAVEALDWVEHPAEIYDFAGLVLAVVIGYIGGSPPHSRAPRPGPRWKGGIRLLRGDVQLRDMRRPVHSFG
jgi:hypothetical protein